MASYVLRRNKIQALIGPPALMLVQDLPNLDGIRRESSTLSSLDSASASTPRPTRSIMRDRRNILDPTDPKPMTSKHSDRGLRSRTRCPGTVTARSSHTNMKRGNSLVLRGLGGGRGGLHRGIWRPLKSISLDVLASSAPRDCLSSGEVGYVDHGVVEG